ncbi:AtpZ/AtpI family protein [Sphingomonas oryzagri]
MAEEEPRQAPDIGAGGVGSSLDERLKAARSAEIARTSRAPAAPSPGYKQGTRVLTELIAGPAGGAIIGWVLQLWLGHAPWLLLGMMALGVVVAFRNIIRISNERPE